MLSKFPAPIVYLSRNIHFLIALFLLTLCVVFWLISIVSYPLNPDAGYYLTAGKYIFNGMVPFRDFHTSYSPGVYYFFGLADILGSKFGEYQKALIYLLHLVNGVILGLILRQLKFDKDLASFASILFILASFCLDGQALVLEPFQNVFILLSLLTAVYLSGYKAACYAGFFIGCALMSKQTSMFSLPIVAALIAFPLCFNLPTVQSKSNLYGRLTIFGIMIGLPFVLFCILTGQSMIAMFVTLVTFGGGAQSYMAQEYGLYDVISVFISGNGGESFLIPIVVTSMLVLFTTKQNIHRLFVAGIALNLITILFVRGYPHYIQLIMPWGIFVLVALIKECDFHNKAILCTLVIIPFISPVFHTAQDLRLQYSKLRIDQQKTLTTKVNQYLKDGANTIVVGYPWLYYTSKITPPEYNLSFVQTEQQIKERIMLAEQIIVMPELVDRFRSLLADKYTGKQFYEANQLKYEKQNVLIYFSR
jgi:hypothetical protein